jgi:replicative DNA helicase
MSKVEFIQYDDTHLNYIKERAKLPPNAVETPFPLLNEACGEEGGRTGLAKGWLVVLGGADGTGKTYLAQNLVSHALEAGHTCGYINFEMSQLGFSTRMLSIVSGLPKYELEQGEFFSEAQWDKATEKWMKLKGRLFVNDEAAFDIEDMRKIYGMFAEAGADMIVIDYAQLVSVPGTNAADTHARTLVVADTLRELTHSHGILTVAISQLTREAKRSKNVSRFGLYGGGAWEHNANQIVLIDHNMQTLIPEMGTRYTRLVLDKNRHGVMPVDIPIEIDIDTMRWSQFVPSPDRHDPFAGSATDPVLVTHERLVAPAVEPIYNQGDMF